MARLSSAYLALALPLTLSSIALAFAIKATTSKDWASQKHFNPNDTDQSTWRMPEFIVYRSPFIVCDDKVCTTFPPYGWNQTSCELYSATLNDAAPTIGDERMCQQVHLAGNLAIASTAFIGIGFVITIVLTLASMLELQARFNEETAEEEHINGHPAKPYHRSRHVRRLSPFTPWANLGLIMAMLMGAAMFVFAQFYGVEALVQSAPDNGYYAQRGFVGGDTNDQGLTGSTNHQPWIQGQAITVYASVSWFAGILAALAAVGAWRLPRTKKIL